jgi:hypothetical protein
VAIFIAQLALPRMKAAKPASQIKSFVRLFGSHTPKYTSVFFFRHTLRKTQISGPYLRAIRNRPVSFLFLPNPAMAWNGPGHLAIAAEAYWELSPELKS